MRESRTVLLKVVAAAGSLVLLSACAGGGAEPPPPPAPRGTPVVADPSAVPPVRTDVEPGQIVAPVLFGVDLDTVRAGRFDQGKMWTFELPPTEYLVETYGFRPDSAWFRKARLGALRIPSCSASFVSPNGLVLTNHHCAREFVTQVQREGESLLDDGFYARDLADERPVEDFEADQLVEIVDVTDEVNRAVDAAAAAERADVRESTLEEIEARLGEERGGEAAGIVVEMVSLYDGGRTSAYVFRRYTNARLVAAPEVQIGFFGGDPDNFTYPRYNLDFSFFRIYDDEGNPLRPDVWFGLDDDGLEEGEPVFIVGNPGSTSRLQTVAELEYRRDIGDRYLVDVLRSRMAVLEDYIRRYPERAEERDLRNEYFGLSNSEKAYAGQVEGLENPVIMARRRDTERSFQEAIEADPALEARYGELIGTLAEIQQEKREVEAETGAFIGFGNPYIDSSTIFRALWATQILIMRQNGAPESDIADMMEGLENTPQMDPELDAALLAARFQDMVDHLGADNPAVQNVLRGRTPRAAADAVVQGTVLADSAGAVAAASDGT
ncbi:MAG TPA: S46 family peptidase, partial [Longimicrobiales bacterium]|nr:S46 family peptidase [Longimicrobiales bacterium]